MIARRNLALLWRTGFVAWVFICAGCSDATRAERFANMGCARCHGTQLEGTRLGPGLLGLDTVWNEETLMEYLNNPADVRARTPRLQELGQRFDVHMPRTPMSDESRRELARYILDGD